MKFKIIPTIVDALGTVPKTLESRVRNLRND